MKLEAGKFYRTADGQKAAVFEIENGVAHGASRYSVHHWDADTGKSRGTPLTGMICISSPEKDIVSEWREPVILTRWVMVRPDRLSYDGYSTCFISPEKAEEPVRGEGWVKKIEIEL